MPSPNKQLIKSSADSFVKAFEFEEEGFASNCIGVKLTKLTNCRTKIIMLDATGGI